MERDTFVLAGACMLIVGMASWLLADILAARRHPGYCGRCGKRLKDRVFDDGYDLIWYLACPASKAIRPPRGSYAPCR